MKKIIATLLLGVTIFTFALSSPALAADTAHGAKIFNANCNACHMRGNNSVINRKTLKKGDLEKYNMYSQEAIITQVTKGKGAMPAFERRLKTQDIEDVAAYVLAQAEKGWR
jgi:cytochrome c6